MRKHYDFTHGLKNPYAAQLKHEATLAERARKRKAPDIVVPKIWPEDPDAVDLNEYNPFPHPPIRVELGSALRARINARRTRQTISLRLSDEHIEGAKRIAERTGTYCQVVLREWIGQGLERAEPKRAQRKKSNALLREPSGHLKRAQHKVPKPRKRT